MPPNVSGPPSLSCEQLRARLDFSDERLLAECSVETRRVSGPGGQHRNKVASGIRLTHRPSGLVVTASERRSQHENKAVACGRLREALALAFRLPPPPVPAWPKNVEVVDGRLRVNERNPSRPGVLALVLDAVAAAGGQIPQAAALLGLTGSSLTRFLSENPKAWAEVNRLRREQGLPTLAPR
jgi:hypothetical protein